MFSPWDGCIEHLCEHCRKLKVGWLGDFIKSDPPIWQKRYYVKLRVCWIIIANCNIFERVWFKFAKCRNIVMCHLRFQMIIFSILVFFITYRRGRALVVILVHPKGVLLCSLLHVDRTPSLQNVNSFLAEDLMWNVFTEKFKLVCL